MKDGQIRIELDRFFSERLAPFYRAVSEANEINVERYSWPCLPYVGDAFESGHHPRILFVGKAPGAWSDRTAEEIQRQGYGNLGECLQRNKTASDLLELSKDCVLQRVLPFYAGGQTDWPLQSPFWRRCYVLTVRTFRSTPNLNCPRNRELSAECFKGIAWTNVFKVGNARGNPDGVMREFLLENFNTLRGEIERIEPEIVVFSTGSTYDKFLQRSLNAQVVSPAERVSEVEGLPSFVKLAIRTSHFQKLRNDELTVLAKKMIRACSAI
jgi:hypothetical protein